jgi:hypothetical protein
MRIGNEERGMAAAAKAATGSDGGHASKERAATRAGPPAESEGPSPFARILHGLSREVDRGEQVTRRAIEGGGKDLGPGELLALQAGVYRYSEAVDLSSKLVDRASSGVKTVLQGQ